MRREDPSLQTIVQQACGGRLRRDVVDAFCQSHGMSFEQFCNAIALKVARDFDDSVMAYQDADAVMNATSGLMTSHLAHTPEANLPEPAWSVYLAFDAGEYNCEDGIDPVERYTRPLIRQVLSGIA